MRLAWFAVLSVVLVSSSAAQAQDRALARALFDEGAKLADKGDFAAACPKFEASLQQEPKLGTKIALAACYERLGRTASAWAEFRDAAAMAGRAGPTEAKREKYASEHARSLEDKLNRLAIMAPQAAPGMVVKRDGQTLPEAVLGVPVPVDPGEHEITATAEGYEPFSQRVKVGAEPTAKVRIPALKKLAAPPVPEPPVTPPATPETHPLTPPPLPVAETQESGTPTLRWVAYGVGGAGVVLVGVGVVFGLSASSKWSDAKDMCTGDSEPLQCTPEGVTLRNDAASAATLSTVTTTVGLVAVAAGVTLFILTPKRSTKVAVGPSAGPGSIGLVVSGGF